MPKNQFTHMKEPSIEKIKQVEYGNVNQLEYQYFPEEYFSGSDITVYFGDIWLDELSALSFTLYEPVKPIHGYASYTWDAVARGARYVEGQFRIPFKEAGYLTVVLEHLAEIGAKARPRLSYLMGDETVPDWVAAVKENIETTLYRFYGNPDAKDDDTYVNETYLDEFEWPTLKHVRLDSNMKDSKQPNKAGRKRQGTINGKHSYKATKYLGSISQLQSRLIELGYGWGEWKWTEGANKGKLINFPVTKRPGGKFPSDAYSLYKPKGNWRLCRRYDANNRSLNGIDYRNLWEAETQKRLASYPGKNSQLATLMGGKNGTIDGRYGGSKNNKTGMAAGVNAFQDLCFAPSGVTNRAPNGNYLTEYVYNELRKGFGVTGEFDTPTRIAVMLFQQDNGLKADGIVDSKTRKALSPTATRKKKIPGESLYKPEKLFENRAAQYEREVWGRAASADVEHQRRTFFYYTMENSEYLREHGFDIYLTYGPYPESVIKSKKQMATELPSSKTNFNTTVKAIRNIQITGVTQILDTSGNPIEEVYTFIAKDLD